MKHYLNICLVSREYPPETGWGGIGTYTYHLAHGLAEKGHQVHVIAQSMDVDKEYMDGNVFVHRIAHKICFRYKGSFKEFGYRLEYSFGVNGKIRELIRRYGIDIVEGPNLSGETFIYSLAKKTPLVTRLHTHFSEVINFVGWNKGFDFKFSCKIEDAVIDRSDLVTCSTRKHSELIAWETGYGLDDIRIIPLGINLLNRETGRQGRNCLSVLFVGRLEKRKGIQVLLKAIPAVIESFPDVIFNIAGRDTFVSKDFVSFDGAYEESFKERILKDFPKKYLSNVNFCGYVDTGQLAGMYESCDIFVAPSLYESFGLIYLEAMSHGKPVIGCGVGGVPEVIEDGITGLLVPPEDHGALAKAISTLLMDKGLRESLGANGRKSAIEKFSRDLMVERTIEAYKHILRK